MAWTTADLCDRFWLYLGRGHGGEVGPDELWTQARTYLWLSDANEQVTTQLATIVPDALLSAPVQLITADGGITYTYPGGAYPFGHVEVWARERGTRELFATTYGDTSGDFVIEGALIRSPDGRPRVYASGPYARYVGTPPELGASQDPVLMPAPARELVLWRALMLAAEVSNGEMDPAPWERKYADAMNRWLLLWKTQYATSGQRARSDVSATWWHDWSAWSNL